MPTKWKFAFISLIMMLLLASLSFSASTYAEFDSNEEKMEIPASRLSLDAKEGIDIVLLIDESGSMAKPSNQPPDYDSWDAPDSPEAFNGGELRLSAAKLIIDLADENDRVAIIYFSDKVLYSQPLTKIRNEQGRRALKKQVRSYFDPLHTGTSYKMALDEAHRLLMRSPKNRQRAVIFLTDGDPQEMIDGQLRKINQGDNPISVEEYLDWLAPTTDKFIETSIPIFPLLFGDYEYPEIANSIAVKTGGIMAELSGTNELLKAYAKIYSRLRPDLFIDYINEGQDDFQVAIEQWKEVNRVSFVFEKSKNQEKSEGRLMSKLNFNGKSLLSPSGRNASKDRYKWQWRVEPHYDLLDIQSRNALDGEWEITWRDDIHRHGLIIARSELSVDMVYPLKSSSVGVGYYASQHGPLIGIDVKRQGHAYPNDDYAPLVFLPNHEQLPMGRVGLSPNNTMWFMQANVPQSSKNQEIIVQLGNFNTPVRMRREFTIRGMALPYLVERDAKTEGGRLIFRFDINLAGQSLAEYDVKGFISDEQKQIINRNATCNESPISGPNDQTIIPCQIVIDYVPGHSYTARLILEGESEGIQYSDFLEMSSTTQRKCFLNLPEQEKELGLLQFGQKTVSFILPVMDYQDACEALSVSVAEVKGADAYPLDPGLLSALLINTPNDEAYELKLLGLENLSPNQYNVRLSFQGGTVPVLPETIYVSFEIPDAEIRVSPNILDFGEITTLGDVYKRPITITFPAPGITSPQFERVDTISTPDENIDTERVEKSLQWSIDPIGDDTAEAQVRTYAATIKLIKSLPPGGYNIPLEVYHEQLPVRSPNKIEMRFVVPESKIIIPDTIMDLGEFYPWPTLYFDSLPPLRSQPTTIPITIPVTLKNTDGNAIGYKISSVPDSQKEQHFHFIEADNEVHRLKSANKQWLLTVTAVMPSDMKAGEYLEKLAFDITSPPYTTISPQTLKFRIKRLTFWQYTWKQIIKLYGNAREAVVGFFTPWWAGSIKLMVVLSLVVLAFNVLRSVYRKVTDTQKRMSGYIVIENDEYELDDKVYAYLIFNKETIMPYIKYSKNDLAPNELLVAEIEADDKEPWDRLQVHMKEECSFTHGNKSYIVALASAESLKPFRGKIYKSNDRFPWGVGKPLHIVFLPQGKTHHFIPSKKLTYFLV